MELRCFFSCHPWNYRTFGAAVIRLCKAGCNCPQYWADGKWKPFDDPLAVAAGTRDRLAGRIQEQSGIAKQEAHRQLEDFMNRNRNGWDLSGR